MKRISERSGVAISMILCPVFFVDAFTTSHLGRLVIGTKINPTLRKHGINRPLSIVQNGSQIVDKSRKSEARTRLQMVFDVSALDVEPEQSKTSGTKQIIDNILDECLRYSARRPIMFQFDPASKSIWRHWRGTVLAETWKSAAWHALWTVAVYYVFQRYAKCAEFLTGFSKIWSELLAVTTFTLTFFVNEAYSCWRRCLDLCYDLQGKINDLSMALAGCATRVEPPRGSDTSAVETTSKFTPAAKKTLTIIARYIRLFNILSYASFTKSHRPLLTPQGMRMMVKRGLLTDKEHSIIVNSSIGATNRHNTVIMWCFRTAMDARKAGHFDGGFGFEQNILQNIQEIRACGNYMECILRGRLQFGYVHIVQVLVNLVSWLYPLMAFSSGLSLQIGVLGVIFITMTYQGLFDLAKRFLDPFHNESFWNGFDPIRVDTLIAETNAGSRRWMLGLEDMPIPMNVIQEGGSDLDLFILPDEGRTAEEVSEMEAMLEEKETQSSQQIGIVDEEKLEEEQQTFQEEFEETQAIMSAPPGADFVPGLEEDEECMVLPEATDTGLPLCEPEEESDDQQPPNAVFDQYLETLTEEYEDALRREEEDNEKIYYQ